MRTLSGKEVCAILKKHGFEQVRQRGSHIIMQKQVPGSTITVPVPDHKELRIGTLMSIIRQSQLDRSLFA
ncbi:MAG: type II toxin-antitoxin system HicA family toxin [Bacteroidetes bacterium]|jgi:predicted RNA binding protein YcfA (HicA-like mRNA interferase family)|nr:type II toxin-antitoxin system HicA family toxin [Bacteroidota bacterium]MCO5274922.1 type II toxin-antitoxin system HicA family toxin [Flavobacteriales bacterium]